MTNVTKAIAAGTIALACAAVQPANAADMPPQYPQYGGPPPVQERYVEERYVYQQPQVYQPTLPPPVIYQEYVPPAVVPVPGPYYVQPRRVYVAPGYRPYGYAYREGYAYRPYVSGYGYHRHHHHHHHHGPRRW